MRNNVSELDADPAAIVRILRDDRRVLLLGPPGAGKSTLAAALAAALERVERACTCLSCDPGSPAFGAPGALCLGRWSGGWIRLGLEPLCSLDAGRFRLPLVQAAHRLSKRAPTGVLLVDGPGVVRGVAGAELLAGLVWAAAIDVVVVLARDGRALPLAAELCNLDAEVYRVSAAREAVATGKRARARARTALWDDYLRPATTRVIDIGELNLTGTPPPPDIAPAWIGRQVALLQGRRCVAMGEVVGMEGRIITAKFVGSSGPGDTLLVRDARRDDKGLLATALPFAADAVRFIPPQGALRESARRSDGPRPVARVGALTATLVNGVFGDPLLHVRLANARRSLLFDLGESGRLPARTTHQVSDVFISHAHVDHIAGFLWLLRSRIGEASVCRVFGPPDIAANVTGLVQGIRWDRIGERGPCFEVAELHGDRLIRRLIQAGIPQAQPLDDLSAADGILLRDTNFLIRAVTLDHRTPVLAFSLEFTREVKVRKERLLALGLTPGPWLTTLKSAVSTGQNETMIGLPDGSHRTAAELAQQLLVISSGRKLVYATDLADTAENRIRLRGLAQGAHTMFCEATFCQTDAAQAARTGHLTARACGEIATSAGVEHLIPIHLSRRYQKDPERIYAEVKAACSATVVPSAFVPHAG